MHFRQITDELLFLDNHYGKLRTAINNYYSFLCDIIDLDDNSFEYSDNQETVLDDGKAISPKEAARCVWDIDRTTQFLRGIYAAIFEAQKRFPDEKIEILYAGCGPLAALAIPLCTKFSPDEISFTLIDIHQRSIDSAQKVFQKLGFDEFVNKYIQTDAAKYQNENDKKFHIIFAEVMQRALDKEPQVAVTLHLSQFLRENGIFIPQKILIEACLLDRGKEFTFGKDIILKRERIYLGQIFELSLESSSRENFLSSKIIEIPNKDLCNLNLALLTKIFIYDDFNLDEYNSGLTMPKVLHNFEQLSNNQRIKFQYVLGKVPRFEYRIL